MRSPKSGSPHGLYGRSVRDLWSRRAFLGNFLFAHKPGLAGFINPLSVYRYCLRVLLSPSDSPVIQQLDCLRLRFERQTLATSEAEDDASTETETILVIVYSVGEARQEILHFGWTNGEPP